MSYETNPILNRTRIIKGWKNSTFPVKTLNYAGQMTLWFKVYLFLKVYLWSQNLRLLTCEIRTTEFHNKILYLSLKKHIPEKKNNRSKWKTRSFLQKIQSPLTKMQNKKARFLLYQDWKTWQHKSEFFFNINKKKRFSKAWLSKPRFSSWINFSLILDVRRKIFLKKLNLLQKKKKILKKKKLVLDKLDTGIPKIKDKAPDYFLTKNIIFQNSLKKLNLLEIRKHQNITQALYKIQKHIIFLKQMLNFQTTWHGLSWHKYFPNLLPDLREEYTRQKNNLKQMEKVYAFFFEKNCEKQKKINLNLISKNFATITLKKKKQIKSRNFWVFSKKQQEKIQKEIFFKSLKTKFVFFTTNNIWKKTLKKRGFIFLTFNKIKFWVQNFENKIFFSEIVKDLWLHNLHSLFLTFKIRRFRKLFKQKKAHIFELVRFEQKNLPLWQNNLDIQEDNNVSSVKKNISQETFSYRLSVRNNYLNSLKQNTNLKLKYLIENLIQQYFSLHVKIKLIWPLAQFKNIKFQRIFFPRYKQFNFQKKSLFLTLNKNLKLQNKRYLYVGHNTNHLQKKNQILRVGNKTDVSKKINREQRFLNLNSHDKKMFFDIKVSAEDLQAPALATYFSQEKEKKNRYLKFKTKIIRLQHEKRASWLSKQKFISNLTTTLTLFAKYLEPQALADHLAELVGTTKRHATILKLMKIALRTVHFKRALGYRIALVGRINGTNKSRTFYLKKLKKNYPRQTFSKTVNFAMSQARATIGAFCIKIWVYS